MKFELVDAAVVLVAIFMLAAYLRLGNIAFVYVFVVLVIAEIAVQAKFRKGRHEAKEKESMS